jgi:hypothetical protein
LKATLAGILPTVTFFIIESAQTLSKAKKMLNNNVTAVTTNKRRINVQETECLFINQALF